MEPVAWIFVGFGIFVGVVLIFLILHHYRFILFGGYTRVVFLSADENITSRHIKLDTKADSFELLQDGEEVKYGIDSDCIYKTGRFRMPIIFYRLGDAEPINMRHPERETKVAAVDYARVAKNKVTKDLLEAFDESFLNPQNILLITIVVIGIGILGLGVFVNSKFDKQNELLFPEPVSTAPLDGDVGVR